jgi:dihydroorotate dehydrogenase (NAD+) catalytic subunit
MLNSVGLQNPGIEEVLKKQFIELKQYYKKPVVADISGFSGEEYVHVAAKIDTVSQVGIVEVNVSCPNVKHGGIAFGTDPPALKSVVAAVKAATKKPVFVKLSPNVTSISALALAAAEAGADGFSLINTLLGARVEIKSRRFVLERGFGGYSGAGIFPVAVRMVAEVKRATGLPVMGMGGVCDARGVIEMMMAGADAVQIGTANLINPYACKEIIEELPAVLRELNIKKISDIIGVAL